MRTSANVGMRGGGCTHLPGPSTNRLISTLGQLRVEESVEGIHARVVVILLTSLHDQIRIEVDDLEHKNGTCSYREADMY